MKKIIEFAKKDYKETRLAFCLYVLFFGFMAMVIFSSAIHGEILLATWQLFYTIIYAMLLETQKQVRYWQKETFKVLEEWQSSTQETVERTLDYVNFLTKAKRDGGEYVMVDNGTQKGIMCLTCLKTSFSEGDIKNLYCAECKKFHKKADEKPM